MPDRNVHRLECHAEQLPRAEERRLDHLVEREVRFDLGLLEIAAALAQLLGVVAPVPGGEREIAALFANDLLHLVAVGERAHFGGLPDGFEQVAHGLRRLRHRVVEAIVRKGGIAQELRALGAQRDHLGDQRLVVGLVVAVAAGNPGAERLLAQIAPR
jgi:hypothetical protein